MTTETLDQPATAEAIAPPGRSRRWGRWTLALVALAAVLTAVWWQLPALLVSWEVATIEFEADAPAARVDGFGIETGSASTVVAYEHGAYATATVTIPSSGPVSTTVHAVRLVADDLSLLHQVEDGVAAPVEGGGSYVADVIVQFDNCEYYHEREAMLITDVEVTSTVLGRQVVERVPLDTPLFVRSPMLWQCPDRVIDRQANNRTDTPRG